MSDINQVLAKHFANESSMEEDRIAFQFKLENPLEYQAIASLWKSRNLKLIKPGKQHAWKEIARESRANSKSPISLFSGMALVIGFIMLGMIGYYFYKSYRTPHHKIHYASLKNEKVTLDDGSVVYLNKNARLTYPKTFHSDKREVALDGEAFFDVVKDASRPFMIETHHSQVKVLGTSFNINTEESITEVAVKTGKVQVKSNFNEDRSILNPNDIAQVTTSNLQVKTNDRGNHNAWMTGVFDFDQATLSEVVTELQTYYDDTIILSITNTDCLFSSTFNKLDIEEVLEIISLSCNISFTHKQDQYELH